MSTACSESVWQRDLASTEISEMAGIARRSGKTSSIPGHRKICQAKRIAPIEALRQEWKLNILYDGNFI